MGGKTTTGGSKNRPRFTIVDYCSELGVPVVEIISRFLRQTGNLQGFGEYYRADVESTQQQNMPICCSLDRFSAFPGGKVRQKLPKSTPRMLKIDTTDIRRFSVEKVRKIMFVWNEKRRISMSRIGVGKVRHPDFGEQFMRPWFVTQSAIGCALMRWRRQGASIAPR